MSPSTTSNTGNVKPITVIHDEVVNVPQDVPSIAIIEDKSDCNALKSINKLWLKVESIALHDTDKQIILDGKWLWGTHLTAVQLILKSQFLNFNGLKDTSLILSKGNTIISESIQVLHVNGNHWVTVSTLDSGNSNFDVTLYDS